MYYTSVSWEMSTNIIKPFQIIACYYSEFHVESEVDYNKSYKDYCKILAEKAVLQV